MTIKCSGGGTRLSGSMLDIIQDFVNVIISMRSSLTDKFSQETADKVIALSGELAYAISDGDKENELEVIKLLSDALGED